MAPAPDDRLDGRDGAIPAEKRLDESEIIHLLAWGLSLGVLLLLARARLMGLAAAGWFAGWKVIPGRIAWAGIGSYYDFLYAALLTVLFGLASGMLRTSRRRRILRGIFLAVALVSLLIAFLNVRIVQILGTPLATRIGGRERSRPPPLPQWRRLRRRRRTGAPSRPCRGLSSSPESISRPKRSHPDGDLLRTKAAGCQTAEFIRELTSPGYCRSRSKSWSRW